MQKREEKTVVLLQAGRGGNPESMGVVSRIEVVEPDYVTMFASRDFALCFTMSRQAVIRV